MSSIRSCTRLQSACTGQERHRFDTTTTGTSFGQAVPVTSFSAWPFCYVNRSTFCLDGFVLMHCYSLLVHKYLTDAGQWFKEESHFCHKLPYITTFFKTNLSPDRMVSHRRGARVSSCIEGSYSKNGCSTVWGGGRVLWEGANFYGGIR